MVSQGSQVVERVLQDGAGLSAVTFYFTAVGLDRAVVQPHLIEFGTVDHALLVLTPGEAQLTAGPAL